MHVLQMKPFLFVEFVTILVHCLDIVLMSKKHCHKYRRRSNPVSSHFLSLYSNYNNIINFFDRNENFVPPIVNRTP